MACLPCPASYSTSFDQLFLRVLTPGWHAMCRIVERVPWFWIGSSVFFLHFLILDFDLCFGACLTRNVSDNWTYSLSSHKTWRASSPLIEPLTFVKIPSTTYLPFIWEGAILRECHSERVPFSGENIGRWSGYYSSSKSFNSGCNSRAWGRVKTQMPFYSLAHREHQHPFSNARIPPLESAMWLKSQECWGFKSWIVEEWIWMQEHIA